MIPKFDVLTQEQVLKLDDKIMTILEEVGCVFEYEPALKVFRDAGFKVEGDKVFFKREDVKALIAKCPSEFKLNARNPEKTVNCNHTDLILTPAYGAPFIYGLNGDVRNSTMEDYDNIVKLTHMSKNINHTGGNVCEPNDVPAELRPMKQLYSHIKYSDKAFNGSAYGVVGATDSVEMAAMIFGGKENLKKNPALITLINSITPLKYDERMLGALMVYAETGQVNLSAYAPTKGAISIMTKCMALEMAPYKINVNAIGPGTILTDINRDELDMEKDEREIPLGIGMPEDLVGIAILLATHESDYMTGHTVFVDGGYNIK